MSIVIRALLLAFFALPAWASPPAADTSYDLADFAHVRKFDAHVHANTDSSAFLEQARADGFELLSINVDYPDFPPADRQRDDALALAARDPRGSIGQPRFRCGDSETRVGWTASRPAWRRTWRVARVG